MNHQVLHDAAVEYAKNLYLPPEYVHDAESAFIAGSGWQAAKLLDEGEHKYDEYTPGSIEAVVHSHVELYHGGHESIEELIGHLKWIIRPKDDDDSAEQRASIKEEPKLPWKQLSLFD